MRPAEAQPQGATPSLFEQLAKNPGTMLTNPQQPLAVPRQRPQAPIQTQTQNSIIAPPPQRAASAPQNPNQGSAFMPPPLQPQLTGYPGQANMHTQVAPPGQSIQELNQQRMMQQQQAALMSQPTGYGGFNAGTNGIMTQPTGYGQFQQQPQGMQFAPYQQMQPTGYPLTMQQQLLNGQQTGSPFADPTANSFQPMQQQNFVHPQQLQPQPTGINAVLPPPLMPQQTGIGPGSFGSNGYGPQQNQVPPVPPIPQGPIAAPLVPQKTGPPPPVKFGVNSGTKKLAPQPTGKRANLAAASKSNYFLFSIHPLMN
jgi:actin cytoskeleton-regulatory complex protein SLA1